jgi:AraC-like DNA-binding protein
MSSSARPAQGTIVLHRESDLPGVSNCNLGQGNRRYHENLILREVSASMSAKSVGSSEPLEQILEPVTKAASTEITRAMSGERTAKKSQCGKVQKRLLQRVLDRIRADLTADLDLPTLAAESGYSRSHFVRTFRAVMECSPHQWLIMLRVEQSKALLRQNSSSLIDIALDCGFSSHAHLSNTFRQLVGVTPSEYRRIHGNNMQNGPLSNESL